MRLTRNHQRQNDMLHWCVVHPFVFLFILYVLNCILYYGHFLIMKILQAFSVGMAILNAIESLAIGGSTAPIRVGNEWFVVTQVPAPGSGAQA